MRLHDRHNRSPRDWAMRQPNENIRNQTYSLIESFRQATMRTTECSFYDTGVADLNANSTPRLRPTFKLPAKFRSTLSALGLVYNETCEYIGPLGTMQGTGFGKVLQTFFMLNLFLNYFPGYRSFMVKEKAQQLYGQFLW